MRWCWWEVGLILEEAALQVEDVFPTFDQNQSI